MANPGNKPGICKALGSKTCSLVPCFFVAPSGVASIAQQLDLGKTTSFFTIDKIAIIGVIIVGYFVISHLGKKRGRRR